MNTVSNNEDNSEPSYDSEVLVRVEGVSKKFCRDLKRSLWYGIQDLSKEFFGLGNEEETHLREKEFWAVKDVSFELRRGECLGLIGHNGAGKSTLLKMLNGLITPDEGKIEMRGRVGALIELGSGFNPILTGRENIYNNGAVLGFSRKEIDEKFDAIVEFSEIGDFLDTPVQNFSSGMKVRLGFAVAAQMEPDVLIIDEVLAVGDQGFKVKCMNRITEILQKASVIFVSHSMPFVLRICTHGILLSKGKGLPSNISVAHVVDQYHSQFRTGKKDIFKTGQIDLSSIDILDADLNPVKSINSGQDFIVAMEFKPHTKIEGINIVVRFWNIEQRPIIDLTPKNNNPFTITNVGELLSLRINVDSINLSAGKYTLSIHISNHEMKAIYRAINIIDLNVLDHYSTPADIYLQSDWS